MLGWDGVWTHETVTFCPRCKWSLTDCPSCGTLQCRCVASIPIGDNLKGHAGIRKHWR